MYVSPAAITTCLRSNTANSFKSIASLKSLFVHIPSLKSCKPVICHSSLSLALRNLSLPTDATVCWHIMSCRLSDCYRVSEGFTASIIRVCLPQLFPASSAVRNIGTYLTKLLTTICTSDWCLLFHIRFFQLCTSFLPICIHKLHYAICCSLPCLPHNFIDCMHFTLLILCTLPYWLYALHPIYCMHFTLLLLYAHYPAVQKPFETVIIVRRSFLGHKTGRNIYPEDGGSMFLRNVSVISILQ